MSKPVLAVGCVIVGAGHGGKRCSAEISMKKCCYLTPYRQCFFKERVYDQIGGRLIRFRRRRVGCHQPALTIAQLEVRSQELAVAVFDGGESFHTPEEVMRRS